jgi:two-component system, OmpR family, sensor histidine kinase SenX3
VKISAFVGAAAHDMKNSVSVIAAYLEDALAQMEGQPAAAGPTVQALYEVQRLNGHLVQMMAIYKLGEGMYPFSPDEVALDEFVAEVAGRVLPLAQTKGLALRTQLDGGAAFFDRDLVTSIVVQALFNAVRYARAFVGLTVGAGSGGALTIEVSDDGPGFPAYMLEHGYATAHGIDSRTGSTGLGLYFARLAAELHRRGGSSGSTRLANGGALGGGRFLLTLP